MTPIIIISSVQLLKRS